MLLFHFQRWGWHLAVQSSDSRGVSLPALLFFPPRTTIWTVPSRLSTLAALDWKESYMGIAGDSWTPLCIFFCCLRALSGRADPHHTFLWSSSFMENYWCARLNCSMLLPPHIRRRNHTLFNSCIKSSSSLAPLCKESGAEKRCISCTRVVLFIYSSRTWGMHIFIYFSVDLVWRKKEIHT